MAPTLVLSVHHTCGHLGMRSQGHQAGRPRVTDSIFPRRSWTSCGWCRYCSFTSQLSEVMMWAGVVLGSTAFRDPAPSGDTACPNVWSPMSQQERERRGRMWGVVCRSGLEGEHITLTHSPLPQLERGRVTVLLTEMEKINSTENKSHGHMSLTTSPASTKEVLLCDYHT